MNPLVSRRQWLGGSLLLPAALPAMLPAPALFAQEEGQQKAGSIPVAGASALPDRQDFPIEGTTYLDNGSQHPISMGARQALQTYLARRALEPDAPPYHLDGDGIRAKFARLINADADEIAFVQSTTAGEQLLLHALGIPASSAHIVTDTLHFFGSFPLYEGLAEQGCDVTWLKPVDGRIRLEDMKRAIRKDTRLVALSLVSTYNGFQHDLKAVCDLAHAQGALVYADIIHAAGCVPLDVRASGVDFAACASYKWLMGDFGLGFLYVRKDRQDQLQRTQFGYYGIGSFVSHSYPLDPPGEAVADYSFQKNATGWFSFGTYSHMGAVLLDYSLDYLLATGVDRIQAHVQPMIRRLKEELPKRGFEVVTPPEAATPIITCVYEDAATKLRPRLEAAGIKITTSRNRFRVTPSVHNDMDDIDRLLKALA